MKAPWSRVTSQPEADLPNGHARALLISIQPRYADAILAGEKTIELRRTAPTLEPGACVLIYSSTPIKAIVGWATIDEIIEATPAALWREHKTLTGVTPSEFKNYFANRPTAYGLRLSEVHVAEQQVTLAGLRNHGLEPPQSWRYLTAELANSMCRYMSPAETTLTAWQLLPRFAGSLAR